MFGRIDHIGVAVEDIDAAIALYEQSFEMELAHRETVESQGVEAVLLDVGDGHVELLRPLGEDTAVGKFLARKGPGLHHVAYAVDDIDATLAQMAAAGIELIDAEARVGIRDSRVAFLHPRSTGGVLTEIVEPAEEGTDGGRAASRDRLRGRPGRLRPAHRGGPQGPSQGGREGRLADVHTDDGVLSLYLGKVAFLRIDSGEHRVGFSQSG